MLGGIVVGGRGSVVGTTVATATVVGIADVDVDGIAIDEIGEPDDDTVAAFRALPAPQPASTAASTPAATSLPLTAERSAARC